MLEHFQSFVAYSSRIFGEAQQAGVLQDHDVLLMCSLVRGSIRSSLRRMRMYDTPVEDRIRHSVEMMCWNAIAAR